MRMNGVGCLNSQRTMFVHWFRRSGRSRWPRIHRAYAGEGGNGETTRIHDGFRGGTDRDGLLQLGGTAARHPRHFGGEAFHVLFLLLESAAGNEHGEVRVLIVKWSAGKGTFTPLALILASKNSWMRSQML